MAPTMSHSISVFATHIVNFVGRSVLSTYSNGMSVNIFHPVRNCGPVLRYLFLFENFLLSELLTRSLFFLQNAPGRYLAFSDNQDMNTHQVLLLDHCNL